MMTTNEASTYILKIINEFKEKKLISDDWKFKFCKSKNVLGKCSYNDEIIYISLYFAQVASLEDIKDVVIHEICHAIAGPNVQSHGKIWKALCIKHGCKPIRCGKIVEGMPAKYIGICPICNTRFHAQRELFNMDKRVCGAKGCTAKKNHKYVIWRKN